MTHHDLVGKIKLWNKLNPKKDPCSICNFKYMDSNCVDLRILFRDKLYVEHFYKSCPVPFVNREQLKVMLLEKI
jgi:hypothetical protein